MTQVSCALKLAEDVGTLAASGYTTTTAERIVDPGAIWLHDAPDGPHLDALAAMTWSIVIN